MPIPEACSDVHQNNGTSQRHTAMIRGSSCPASLPPALRAYAREGGACRACQERAIEGRSRITLLSRGQVVTRRPFDRKKEQYTTDKRVVASSCHARTIAVRVKPSRHLPKIKVKLSSADTPCLFIPTLGVTAAAVGCNYGVTVQLSGSTGKCRHCIRTSWKARSMMAERGWVLSFVSFPHVYPQSFHDRLAVLPIIAVLQHLCTRVP